MPGGRGGSFDAGAAVGAAAATLADGVLEIVPSTMPPEQKFMVSGERGTRHDRGPLLCVFLWIPHVV